MASATLTAPVSIESPPPSSEAVAATRRLFTTDEYHRMIEIGIFDRDENFELINGEILKMATMGPPHIFCIGRLNRLLVRQVGDEILVHVQVPVQMPTYSEPEPDFSLVRANYDVRVTPKIADVYLVMEISDSSRRVDRVIKLPLYAAVGIPEAWIFDVNARRVERFTDPTPDGYKTIQTAGPGQTLASTVLPQVRIPIDEVFGPVAETDATDKTTGAG
jgi:Uma2 family endonuclease